MWVAGRMDVGIGIPLTKSQNIAAFDPNERTATFYSVVTCRQLLLAAKPADLTKKSGNLVQEL